jgi:hypothetical protein
MYAWMYHDVLDAVFEITNKHFQHSLTVEQNLTGHLTNSLNYLILFPRKCNIADLLFYLAN